MIAIGDGLTGAVCIARVLVEHGRVVDLAGLDPRRRPARRQGGWTCRTNRAAACARISSPCATRSSG
ncbi:MAG: hypothetical protein WDN49_16925 [Acetobacteraceae bacterium]